tara:strand:- start:251 stop:919 length:669 start_codon:yes stop_codon:yes gene_type:complete
MNLEKLEKNFEKAGSNLDLQEMVEKAVVYAEACQQQRKYDSAISCLKKLLPRVDKEKGHKAIVLTALGIAYWEKAQLKKALSNFEEALQLFKKLGDKAGKAEILSIVGITYWRKCEWDRALQILENALNLNTDKDKRFVSLYGAFDRGLATLQNRIRIGRELEQPMKILQPLFSSIALHLIERNWKAFKTCLEESEMLAKQIGHKDILKAIKGVSVLAAQFS